MSLILCGSDRWCLAVAALEFPMLEPDGCVSIGGANNSPAPDQVQLSTHVQRDGPVDGNFNLPSERDRRHRGEQNPSAANVARPPPNPPFPPALTFHIPPTF